MNWLNPIGGGFKSNKAQRKQNQIVLLSQTKTLGNANLIEKIIELLTVNRLQMDLPRVVNAHDSGHKYEGIGDLGHSKL